MELKHTHGPWVKRRPEEVNRCFEVMTEDGYYIATCHDGVHEQSNSEENARLISAAPELLEALQKMVDYWDSEIKSEYEGTTIYKDRLSEIDFAREVIAKATVQTKE